MQLTNTRMWAHDGSETPAYWNLFMGKSYSIKNVSEDMAEDLRALAARNHRSVQGELMAMLEERLRGGRRLNALEAAQEAGRLGIRSRGHSADIIREIRDHEAR